VTVRSMTAQDVPILERLHATSGYTHAFPSGPIEDAVVIVDETDHPIMAAIAERTIQLNFICGKERPLAVLHGLRLLHGALREALKPKGYRMADAWLPPEICESFGRLLGKRFGWAKNLWPSFSVKI
jgi:hypothetical protein